MGGPDSSAHEKGQVVQKNRPVGGEGAAPGASKKFGRKEGGRPEGLGRPGRVCVAVRMFEDAANQSAMVVESKLPAGAGGAR